METRQFGKTDMQLSVVGCGGEGDRYRESHSRGGRWPNFTVAPSLIKSTRIGQESLTYLHSIMLWNLSERVRRIAPGCDHPEAMVHGLNTRLAYTGGVQDGLRVANGVLNLHHVHPIPVHHDRQVARELPGIHHRDSAARKGVPKSHG